MDKEEKMSEELLKEMNEKLQTIENLLILQLIREGVPDSQIEDALKIKKVPPSKLRASFPAGKFRRKNAKED